MGSVLLGSSAIILAAVCYLVPVFGTVLSVVPSVLALFTHRRGYPLGLLAIGANLVNVLAFSPVMGRTALANLAEGSPRTALIVLGVAGFHLGMLVWLVARHRRHLLEQM